VTLNETIASLERQGYRVSKPRRHRTAPSVNAIGKPMSPLYDPNYKMKVPRTSIARLLAPMPAETKYR